MIDALALAIIGYGLVAAWFYVAHILRELPTPNSRPPVRNPPPPEGQ